MSKSKIQWTDDVWNPVTGCNKVSQGCKNCYAEIMHRRLMKMMPGKYNRPFLDGAFPHEPSLEIPLKRKTPTKYFVNSMSDLFHPLAPFEFIRKVFEVMYFSSQHTFIILTKRPQRMKEYFDHVLQRAKLEFEDDGIYHIPHKNVWLGVSVEDQQTADERIPLLLETPAAVRFISAEPLLGNIQIPKISYRDIGPICSSCSGNGNYSDNFRTPCPDCKTTGQNPTGLHWVIAGGESGRRARPCNPDWIRSLRDQCKEVNVPFFFKQWGEWVPDELGETVIYQNGNTISRKEFITGDDTNSFWAHAVSKVGKKKAGRLLDGVEHNDMPG